MGIRFVPNLKVIGAQKFGFPAKTVKNIKWAWQVQFLSHTLHILGKVIFLEDLQMMSLSSLEIFTFTKVGKNVPNLDVQVWRSL